MEENKNTQPDEFELKIKYNTITGEIAIDGPIKNEMLCLWLLEKSKDICKAFSQKKPSELIPPRGGMMDFVRRNKRF